MREALPGRRARSQAEYRVVGSGSAAHGLDDVAEAEQRVDDRRRLRAPRRAPAHLPRLDRRAAAARRDLPGRDRAARLPRARPTDTPVKRIGVSFVDTPEAHEALRFAAALAKETGASLTLYTVVARACRGVLADHRPRRRGGVPGDGPRGRARRAGQGGRVAARGHRGDRGAARGRHRRRARGAGRARVRPAGLRLARLRAGAAGAARRRAAQARSAGPRARSWWCREEPPSGRRSEPEAAIGAGTALLGTDQPPPGRLAAALELELGAGRARGRRRCRASSGAPSPSITVSSSASRPSSPSTTSRVSPGSPHATSSSSMKPTESPRRKRPCVSSRAASVTPPVRTRRSVSSIAAAFVARVVRSGPARRRRPGRRPSSASARPGRPSRRAPRRARRPCGRSASSGSTTTSSAGTSWMPASSS